jgi:hypothetical protein
VAEACKPGAAQAVFTDDRQASNRWPLLFYALWWTIHIGGATPAEAADSVFGAA